MKTKTIYLVLGIHEDGNGKWHDSVHEFWSYGTANSVIENPGRSERFSPVIYAIELPVTAWPTADVDCECKYVTPVAIDAREE